MTRKEVQERLYSALNSGKLDWKEPHYLVKVYDVWIEAKGSYKMLDDFKPPKEVDRDELKQLLESWDRLQQCIEFRKNNV